MIALPAPTTPRRILPAILALGLLAACEPDEQGTFTSPGGHVFHFVQRPDANVVALHMAIPMDWTLQPGKNPVVPQIAADAMTSGGAEGYSPSDILETMQDLHAEAFLFPDKATLRGGINVEPEDIDPVMKLANAVLRAPNFDPVWFQRTKDSWITSVREQMVLPRQQGNLALRLAVAGDSPYTAAMSPSDPALIEAVTVDMARQWHKETLAFGAAIIAVAGPITSAEAGVMVDKLLDGLPMDKRSFAKPVLPAYRPKQVLLHDPKAEKTSLAVMLPMPKLGTDDDLMDAVAALALAADEQSILFQKIRTELRATYGLAFSLDQFSHDTTFLSLLGEIETAQTQAVRDMVLQTLDEMKSKPLPAELVDRYKGMIEGSLPDLHNNTTEHARTMVDSALQGADPFSITRMQAILNLVSPSSIQNRWVQKYPPADQAMVMVVSPDAAALPGACVITAAVQVLTCPE